MNYIPNTDNDQKKMLKKIGKPSIDSLFEDIPENLKINDLNIPKALSELELKQHIFKLSKMNSGSDKISFLGGGTYSHYIPSTIDYVISRPEFYTAYTPYQPEVSQGTLQSIFEYQSMMCELTKMDICNASMYDGGSAMAEAARMAVNNIKKANTILISDSVNPLYIKQLRTYCNTENIVVLKSSNGVIDLEKLKAELNDDIACFIAQSPNFFGYIEDMEEISNIVHTQKKTAFISVVNPITLGLLTAPGEYKADIAVGEAQTLGLPVSYGGPYLGFITVTNKFMRKIPGRLAGVAYDNDGNRGYVLTLSTREQHIRRDKASSNICSNEALCALASGVYLATMGKNGIKEVDELMVQKSHYLAEKISNIPGFSIKWNNSFFNEFTINCPKDPEIICNNLKEKGFLAGIPLKWFYNDKEFKDLIIIAVTENITKDNIDSFIEALEEVK